MAILRGGRRIGNYDIRVGVPRDRSLDYVNDDEILIIGDTSHDFEVAKLLNINCILFSSGHYSKKRLIKNNCLIVDDHLDLKLILG